jgi:hypothetical protein
VLCSVVNIHERRTSAVRRITRITYIIIVFPNLRQVLDHFDTNLRQVLLGDDSRDEQNMWRSNSTAAKDDFTVGFDMILGRDWGFGYFNTNRTGF